MLQGDHHHRRVHPKRWTRHSISSITRSISRRRTRLITRSLIIIILMGISSISVKRINNMISNINLLLSRSSLLLSRSSLMSSRSSLNSRGGRGGAGCGVRGQTEWLWRGPSEATLLPQFGRHVTCRIWVDANVSIFNIYFTYFNIYFNVYFTY